MNPIRTTRYASAQGFNPATAPNTAEQQRRQDDEFIRQYREAKEIELAQEADRLARLKANNQIERSSLSKSLNEQEQYQQQQDRIKLNQIEREYQAQKSVTGMNKKDARFNDALKLITDLSKTAIQATAQIGVKIAEEQKAKANLTFQQGLAEGTLFIDPATSKEAMAKAEGMLGAGLQHTALTTVQHKQQSDATQIGYLGTPQAIDIEAKYKNESSVFRNELRRLVAGQIGKNYANQRLAFLQQQQQQNPDFEVEVDGEIKRIADVNLNDSQQVQAVLQGGISEVLKQNGLEEQSDFFLKDFYQNASKGIQQTVGTLRNAEIKAQTADRIDNAASIFRLDPTPINAKQLYNTLTQAGQSAKQARTGMLAQFTSIPDRDFEALGAMPFGPNDLSLKEQYPVEYQQAVNERDNFKKQKRAARRFELESQNEEFLLDFEEAALNDVSEDGSFDANPEVLSDLADQRELLGDEKGAAAVRAKIPLTRNNLYDSRFVEQLKEDADLGILNFSLQQIMNNQSLSAKGKRQAIDIVKAYNETSVPENIKVKAVGTMNKALKNRLKTNLYTKGGDSFTLEIKQAQAWSEYSSVYNAALQATGNPDAAADAAINDFYAKYNDVNGTYRVTSALDGEPAAFVDVDTAGKVYEPSVNLLEIDKKVATEGSSVAFSQPELYDGESKELELMMDNIGKTGKVVIPETIQRVQRKFGGTMSLRQFLNKRLGANQIDVLPNDVGQLADEVESAFDPRYNKFLNYMPNPTRTDIAAIGSGQDPIYEERQLKYGEESLIAALDAAGMTNKNERAMFISQMAHESGNFKYTEEIHDGSNYEGRQDLGNTQPGDGKRFKGRGYIQLTGRANYRQYGKLVGVDLENNPELAADPAIAAKVALAYWNKRVDREAAQAGDVRTVTKNINGGYNGLADRQDKWKQYSAKAKVVRSENAWRQPMNMRPELMEAR
jgi:predicted chitinase